MENTHRDVNIALANEFAKIAGEFGVSVHEAISLANEHPRVDLLRPGPGVGGHCITIDPQFLVHSVAHSRLISTAREINDGMAGHLLRLVRETLNGAPGRAITVFGVAYKGDVADTRETPALPFIELARNAGYDVRVYDPYVEDFAIAPQPLDAAIEGSDCVVVLADHGEFETIDPAAFADRMRNRTVVDSRAIVDRERWREAGFRVRVLGDGTTRE
jgi:UDP-N-acetyl-D-mannosaminuronic acid dehydrogenase